MGLWRELNDHPINRVSFLLAKLTVAGLCPVQKATPKESAGVVACPGSPKSFVSPVYSFLLEKCLFRRYFLVSPDKSCQKY
jgi:hypothetical protein